MTTTDKLNYKDVTNDWIKNRKNYKSIKDATYYEHNGTKYYVDGKKVVLDYSEKEKEVALWLVNTFGGEVIMVPRVNYPFNINTPDYLFNNMKFDLKEVKGNSVRTIDNLVKNNKHQSCNFIFDISISKLNENEIIKQTKKLFMSQQRFWINTIIIKNNNKLIKIFKRYKKRSSPQPNNCGPGRLLLYL